MEGCPSAERRPVGPNVDEDSGVDDARHDGAGDSAADRPDIDAIADFDADGPAGTGRDAQAHRLAVVRRAGACFADTSATPAAAAGCEASVVLAARGQGAGLAADAAVQGIRPAGWPGTGIRPPAGHPDDSRVEDLEAVEEPLDLFLRPYIHLRRRIPADIPHALDYPSGSSSGVSG
jgi:hypothetical protein